MRGLFVHWVRAALLVFACAGWGGIAVAQDLQPVPALTGHVIDGSGTLSESQRQALDARLAAFERDKGAQVVVLMVATTQPEDIASYANRIGNAWKIGRKDVGDGLLLVVAKNDRKVRIEVAKSLEGAIPDLAAKQIIDDAITPRFRQGDFAGGLDAAAERIMALISHEALPAPSSGGPGSSSGDESLIELAGAAFFAIFFAGFFIGPIARRILGRKLGAAVTGGGLGTLVAYMGSPVVLAAVAGFAAFATVLITGHDGVSRGRLAQSRGRRGRRGGRGEWTSGAGGFGGGFGGSSGGGSSDSFSSGGGGDFGGGGASGDW